ncbi:MAG: AraC family transcriptional regulator [Rhodoferax sp.]|nr:AraC family transcriptional regulator [Rhodoferax sp.]
MYRRPRDPLPPSSSDFHVHGNTRSQAHTPAYDLRLMVPNRPAHEIAVHRHDDAHLILVVQGDYQTSAIRNGRLHAGEPLLVLNPPRTEHLDCFAATQVLPQARFFSLTLSAETWFQTSRAMDLPTGPTAVEGAAVRHIAALWADCVGVEADTECALMDALAPFSLDAASVAPSSAQWVRQVQRHLRDQVVDGQDVVRMTDVAANLGVHPVYLARAFRKHLGVSPTAYVRTVQLDKAAALLTQSCMSLLEIALECLYFDQAHMAHAFKAAYGLSPSAFRARKLQ